MKIKQSKIATHMGMGGQCWKMIWDFSDEDIAVLDAIGYGTEKRFTRTEYLNNKYKDKYMFDVIQTRADFGDFFEEFNVVIVEL